MRASWPGRRSSPSATRGGRLSGGAWNRSGEFDLAVGNRMAASPSSKDRYDVGFRVLLMRD